MERRQKGDVTTRKAPPHGRPRRVNKTSTGRELASGTDGIVAVLSPNSEATAASGRSQDGDILGFQHLQQAELGGCGECACRGRTERGGEAGPAASGQGSVCGVAKRTGWILCRGLARLEREAGGRPAAGLEGGGLARGRDRPFPSLPLHSFRSGLFSRRLPEVQTAPPPVTGPCWTSGPCSALFPTLAPRPSPPLGPTSVARMAGSSEPGPQPHLPFSPGLPHSVPDVSWRKPIYPNGE